ncbi:MAG: hypothetical protein A4S12_02535 [Proteobacteria bacterium SG_bin5]|nr:hypothetical protein [Sphingomonas sp.]OQW39300.1 MAG: hypothetical protein A4S12_02535 [Proteobacteria bacterium SG_bin5]
MTDPMLYLTLASAALMGLAMITWATLAGWRGWLQLKAQELTRTGGTGEPTMPSASARIEIADLKERIRKLEAIAAGVDL